MVETSILSTPGPHRDVQRSLTVKVADGIRGTVLHGATLRHVDAPFHALFLGFLVIPEDIVPHDATARVFEEGFL